MIPKQCRRVPEIVARQPGTTLSRGTPGRVLRVVILLAVAAGLYLTFELGRIQADYNIVDVASERRAYEKQIEDLENNIQSLKEQVALLETHRDIDREAYAEVEAGLTGLQQKIHEQREAIAFYRGIISPADGAHGLRVQELKVSKGKDERLYHVSLVLVQVLQHDRSVKGDVEFSLEGAQDGVATTYTLAQLVPEDENSDWPFSFRYFQNLDRRLILPDGFTPEKVNIEIRSRTKSVASASQSFLWQSSSQG
jgi:cell division protein FtsB